ncbi:unnamed protein product [Ophioblennius macclurei]
MPTNQSSPWDGRKPRLHPDGPTPAAIKVPSDPLGDGSSGRTDQAKDVSLWGGQTGSHPAPLWSCSTTVPPGSFTTGSGSPGSVPSECLTIKSLPPRSLTARSVPPRSVPPESLTTRSVPPGSLTAKSIPSETLTTRSVPSEYLTIRSLPPGYLTTRSVPPESLTTKSVPPESLTTKSVPPESLTIGCRPPGSLTTRSMPTGSVPSEVTCADAAAGSPQQVTRRPSRKFSSCVTTEAPDSSALPCQCLHHQQASSSSRSSSRSSRRIRSSKVSVRRPLSSGSKQGRSWSRRSSSQEEKEEQEKKEEHITVGCVTSHISSICLTPAPPASPAIPAPPASPATPVPPASPATPASPAPHVHLRVDDGTQLNVVKEDEDDDDDDEEPDDDLENHLSDESDCYSITATSSCASIAAPCSIEESMSPEDVEERPALVPSLFPLVTPTLYFSTANEKVELLPAEQRRLLKWKLTNVTPNVVKDTIARSHFKVTKKSNDWLGCWGHHMRSSGFKALAEHQKLNHFPGTFQIGRKDRLWRNLSKMQLRFGKQEFGFFPRTFVLPQDIKLLRKAWEDGGSRHKWIIKPPASARGIGIQVIHKWSQLPRKRPLLVQKYLHKPYLIGGNKFDLRIYVYATCYDPLRVYIFSDGLVRFASCKYSSSMKTLGNKFMHLTNYSVNKKNTEYQSNSDEKACQGHKWALKALWQFLGSRGINTTLIWEKIKDIVIKTIIASEPYVNSNLKTHVRSASSCHELFGFDIMLDENLKPWILEVNISPSLHSNTALDLSVKGQMIRDLLNLAGFRLPQREELSPCSSASSSSSSLCGGSRSRVELSADEKVKRAFYLTQRHAEQDFLSSVLDVLTPEDVRVLAESEDELSRRGDFQRVFPADASTRYLRFFECPRYANLLLDQWEQRHGANRTRGIERLSALCQRGVHLGTNDPAHMWSKASYVSRCEANKQDLLSPSRSSRVCVSHHTEEDSSDQDGSSVCSIPMSPCSES